jgi:hypothetical protein
MRSTVSTAEEKHSEPNEAVKQWRSARRSEVGARADEEPSAAGPDVVEGVLKYHCGGSRGEGREWRGFPYISERLVDGRVPRWEGADELGTRRAEKQQGWEVAGELSGVPGR